MPFIVSAEKGMLVLSVGGGTEEKVTSTERLQGGTAPVKGPAVVGIDLEDLPDASNVVIATAGDPPYQVSKKAGGVTLVFKGAVAEKGLLRRIDARKFDIPVKAIAPSGGKNGVTVAVAFAPGAAYTVEKRDGSVVVAFPKGVTEGKADLVARRLRGVRRMSQRCTRRRNLRTRTGSRPNSRARSHGDSSPGVPTSGENIVGSGSPWTSRTPTSPTCSGSSPRSAT